MARLESTGRAVLAAALGGRVRRRRGDRDDRPRRPRPRSGPATPAPPDHSAFRRGGGRAGRGGARARPGRRPLDRRLLDAASAVLAKGYGHADGEAARPAASAETSYPIASVSKLFTAAAVLRLADQGKLSLDDPLAASFPTRGRRSACSRCGTCSTTRPASRAAAPRPHGRAERAAARAAPRVPPARLGLQQLQLLAARPRDRTSHRAATTRARARRARDAARPHRHRLLRGRHARAGPRPRLPVRRHGASRRPPTGRARASSRAAGCARPCWTWSRSSARWRTGASSARPCSRRCARPRRLAGGIEADYGLGTRLGSTAGRTKVGHTGGGQGNKAVLARYPDEDVTIAVLLNTERDHAEVTPNELEERIARLFFAGAGRRRGRPGVRRAAPVRRPVPRGTAAVERDGGRRHAAAASRAARPEAVALFAAPGGGLVSADDPSVELRFQVANGESLALSRYRNGWFSGVAVRSAEPFVEVPTRPRSKGRRTRARARS